MKKQKIFTIVESFIQFCQNLNFGQEKNIEYVAYVIIGSIIILFKHTDNIKRLISKTEPKIGNSAKKQKNDD